jgi:hypothetical protein
MPKIAARNGSTRISWIAGGLTLLVCMLATPLAAQQQPGWVIMGDGNDSCGKYIAAVQPFLPGKGQTFRAITGKVWFDDAGLYAQWIQGYISGINQMSKPDPAAQMGVDYPGIDLWLRKWCQAHPTNSLVDAVSALIKDHWGAAQYQRK